MQRFVKQTAYNIIGSNVKEYRIKRNMSQKELSEKLETYGILICRGSVCRLENKQRTVTDYELKALADIFKISINDLFRDI